MSDHVRVVGSGSLIHPASLQRTCPGARITARVWVAGWRRTWTLAADGPPVGDGTGPTFVDAERDAAARFNGVLIAVPRDEYAALLAREHLYDAVEAAVVDFDDGCDRGTAITWSSGSEPIAVDWQDPRQQRYAAICLRGALEQGAMFYEAFLRTTWIGDDSLDALRRRIPLLASMVAAPPAVQDP